MLNWHLLIRSTDMIRLVNDVVIGCLNPFGDVLILIVWVLYVCCPCTRHYMRV